MLMIEDKIAKMVNMVADAIEGYDIGCYDDDCEMRDEWNYYIERLLQRVDPEVKVCYGISKMVIIPSFGDIVIKFPMRGTWFEKDYEEVWNEEEKRWEEEYFDEPEYEFSEFAYGGGDDGSDYCALEVSIYNDIVADQPEFAFLFPKTQYYARVKGTNFYVQEKCVELYNFEGEEASENSKKVAEEIKKNQYKIDSRYWIEMLVEKVGETLAQRVFDFLEDYNISDLHNHNIGFDMKTGMPKLIDFCGFDS